jgi:hypothetical protein
VVNPWGREAWLLSPTLGPLLLLAGTGLALALARARPRLAGALLGGLLAHDLLREGIVYNPSCPPAALYPDTPGVARLRELQGAGRVLLGGGIREDLLRVAGLRTPGGYASLRAARTDALLGRWDPAPGRQNLSPRALPPAWRDALAVTAVACAPGTSPLQPRGLHLDRAGADLEVWRNPSALPRARLVPPEAVFVRPDRQAALALLAEPWFDPRRHLVVEEPGPPRDGRREVPPPEPARLVRDDPQRVELELTAPRGGVLLLADAWSSGWSVAPGEGTAGAALRALPADVALRAVRLPAGFQGTVVWTFALPGRAAGRLVSALALLALAGGLYRARAGARR